MSFKDIEFKHDEEKFHKALNVPDAVQEIVQEKILFTSFSNALQVHDLFEDTDDIPLTMSTTTGDLERTITMMSSSIEYDYMLLTFTAIHNLSKEAFREYMIRNISKRKSSNTEDELKTQLLEAVMKLRDLHQGKRNKKNAFDLDADSLLKRIKYVKKSKYNFDRYISYLKGETPKTDFNVDGLLGDILGKTDD